MKKMFEKILRHRRLVIAFFVIMAIAGVATSQLVSVNYDMKDYLPKDSSSSVSLEIMEEQYDSGIPGARVMVRDVTIPEALEYKEKLSRCTGVREITWLDDSADLSQPLSFIDEDLLDTYYKNGNALFSIVVDEEKDMECVAEMREVIGEENAMTGNSVASAVAKVNTVKEIRIISLLAVAFVIFVLLLTTDAWIEPVIVMLGLGAAIAINAGTNVIFGEISFVTNAAGNILQLAVSLDYSVFLLHRFREYLEEGKTPYEAMLDAMTRSTGSILSSGLTTVIGFLALIFMRFGIGPDLGLALAKGVAISLITVFTLMPSLVLRMYGLIEKTNHRKLLPSFEKFGKLVSKTMVPLAAVFVLTVVPSYLASNSNEFYYGAEYIYGTETKLGQDTRTIENVFGKSDTYVLMVPKGDFPAEKALSAEIKKLPEVKSIISYVDTVGAEIPEDFLEEDTLNQLISEDYSRMIINVEEGYDGESAFELVEKIRSIAEEYYPDGYYMAGEGVSTTDLKDTITADTVKVNLIAIGAVFLVLLLTFRSLLKPLILVLVIESAIWINLSVPYFCGSTVFYISYLIISSIQLGATVDYAILFTDRYLEYRHEQPKLESIRDTVSTVTVSMLTSGMTLTVVGFLLGMLSSHGILAQLGIFIGRGALLSQLNVLFVLPGLLYIFDRDRKGKLKDEEI
ncbi:MAG: RND family transporter [Anaerovoracaceae bacterium]